MLATRRVTAEILCTFIAMSPNIPSAHGKRQASRRNARFQLRTGAARSIIGAMTRPAAIPEVRRTRGNPNWGRFVPPTPVVATEFELQVRHLRLTRETYVFSAELRRWCWQNRNRFYIPEWLQEEWHITVDPNVAA
jgi:hypothetical protein